LPWFHYNGFINDITFNFIMKTIPDAIDDVKEVWRKIIDTVYGVIEHHSVKLSSWSWQKRWGNRDRGTGYSRDDK
jgi:hypothetical protein